MPLPYWEFAIWVLSDLAEREPGKHQGRIIFSGNYISCQHQVPVPCVGETEEQFAARFKKFRKKLPRGSDWTRRLAMAVEAVIKSGNTSKEAISRLWDELEKRMPNHLKKERVDWEKRGVPHKRIKIRIGTTRRGHRTKMKREGFSLDDRQMETIRAQVSRFKRNCPNFKQQFDAEIGAYRFQFCRDADWLAEMEQVYRLRMTEAEAKLGEYQELTAGNTVIYARLLHEQGRFDEAEMWYERALERWDAAPAIPEWRREPLIISVREDIEGCKKRLPPGPIPIATPPGVPPMPGVYIGGKRKR